MDQLKVAKAESAVAPVDDLRDEAEDQIVVEEIPSFESALLQFDGGRGPV